jgi:hypothetical protein
MIVRVKPRAVSAVEGAMSAIPVYVVRPHLPRCLAIQGVLWLGGLESALLQVYVFTHGYVLPRMPSRRSLGAALHSCMLTTSSMHNTCSVSGPQS